MSLYELPAAKFMSISVACLPRRIKEPEALFPTVALVLSTRRCSLGTTFRVPIASYWLSLRDCGAFCTDCSTRGTTLLFLPNLIPLLAVRLFLWFRDCPTAVGLGGFWATDKLCDAAGWLLECRKPGSGTRGLGANDWPSLFSPAESLNSAFA